MSLQERLAALQGELEKMLGDAWKVGYQKGQSVVVERVKGELDALRKDKERLDWLAKNDDAMFDLQSRMNASSFREAVDLSMEM